MLAVDQTERLHGALQLQARRLVVVVGSPVRVALCAAHGIEQQVADAQPNGHLAIGHERRLAVHGRVERTAQRLRLTEREGDPVPAHLAHEELLRLHDAQELHAGHTELAVARVAVHGA